MNFETLRPLLLPCAVTAAAVARGALTQSAAERLSGQAAASLIFHDGVSTARNVTDVSGRGVGMDAIRKFLNKHNGDVRISFTGDPVTPGFRPFQLIITLPARFAVQVA